MSRGTTNAPNSLSLDPPEELTNRILDRLHRHAELQTESLRIIAWWTRVGWGMLLGAALMLLLLKHC